MRNPYFVAIAFLTLSHITQARVVRSWSYEELYKDSDVVAIISPLHVINNETVMAYRHADTTAFQGITTTFLVNATLKAKDKLPDKIDIHHFRYKHQKPGLDPAGVIEFPLQEPSSLVFRFNNDSDSFILGGSINIEFIAFLKIDQAGRLVPTSGQYDPVFSFMLLFKPAFIDKMNTSTKRKHRIHTDPIQIQSSGSGNLWNKK